ncbi:optic atrophy 3 protein homolog isoform X2 [Vanessa atalanta]|uniref:optic atrophy 3 protein homolog isoform X2 n=1 Tax=Vanessa atalanta TaxID=42275 RepID=UPI001FCD639F|nr:optic atrophy 3 protein homolog isoform X2 [Vanessa atalanta]
MVGNQFPMFRFATLMARQLSSPVAARIKRYAVSHPRFGVAVCIRIANLFHWCEWNTRAWTLRLAGITLPANARPPPLPVRTAVNLGGDLLEVKQEVRVVGGRFVSGGAAARTGAAATRHRALSLYTASAEIPPGAN